jgi:hypothetical protein
VIKELSENGSANVHSPLCTDPAPAAPEDRFQPLRLQIEKNKTTPNLKPCRRLAEFQKSSSGQYWGEIEGYKTSMGG